MFRHNLTEMSTMQEGMHNNASRKGHGLKRQVQAHSHPLLRFMSLPLRVLGQVTPGLQEAWAIVYLPQGQCLIHGHCFFPESGASSDSPISSVSFTPRGTISSTGAS